MISNHRDTGNANNLLSSNITYHFCSAKLKTHRKLPCALLSAFENSASEFTKRIFDEPAQNRLNNSAILNAKGLLPMVNI